MNIKTILILATMAAVMGIMLSNVSEQGHFVTPVSTISTNTPSADTPTLDLSIVNSPNIYTNSETNNDTHNDLNSDTNDEDLALNKDNLSDTDSSEFISSRDIGKSSRDIANGMFNNGLTNTTSTIIRLPLYDTTHLGNRIIYTETKSNMSCQPESFTQYDNIYGSITISHIAKCMTNHPYFQRLKNIKQLGPLHFKFPYAAHSRYEHSIGVAYLARYTGILLKGKNRSITDKEILCLELAALCHDLGHGAYSHSFDHLLRDIGFKHKTAHHEVRSQLLVRYMIEDMIKNADNTEHKHQLDHNLDESAIRLIQYFIDTESYSTIYPNESIPKFTAGLEQIVSNPIHKLDIDKMDYLLRDAQALRFDLTVSGELDIKGLLARSQIVPDINNKQIWMFHIRDQGTVYDLICRRFIFYNNYYLHPQVNALNCMLTDALKIVDRVYEFSKYAKLETVEDADTYIKLTDDYFLELILNSNDERIAGAKDLIQRIVSKKGWYKHLGDFVTNVENLDETAYAELPWEIFTDKSTPTNILPKIRYHQNGVAVDPKKITNMRRLYLKE